MASDVTDDRTPAPLLDGAGDLRVTVVCARFNGAITLRLLDGARRALASAGVSDLAVTEAWVAGAFELPVVTAGCARSGHVDAVVALGCVIRGETPHFELVAGQCAAGLQQVATLTGVPVGFGVLTTEDIDQAMARSEDGDGHNVGADAVVAALEAACLLRRVAAARLRE